MATTVAELIAALQTLPRDATIWLDGYDGEIWVKPKDGMSLGPSDLPDALRFI